MQPTLNRPTCDALADVLADVYAFLLRRKAQTETPQTASVHEAGAISGAASAVHGEPHYANSTPTST